MGEVYVKARDYLTQLFSRLFVSRVGRNDAARVELFALYDFTPSPPHSGQLAFATGDELLLKSARDPKWWLCTHTRTGKKGYVPKNFVARTTERLHMEWFDMQMSRDKAQERLANEEYGPGSFIIRRKDGKHFSEALVLSVKMEINEVMRILHFEIVRDHDTFRLHGGQTFTTLTLLVQYYAGHYSNLTQPLTYSVKKSCAIDVWEIEDDQLMVETKKEMEIGNGNFGEVHRGKLHGHDVAVKTIKPGVMRNEDFMKEATIAREFSHANIVKTIGICWKTIDSTKKLHIVTEFVPGSNLREYLVDNAASIRYAELQPIALKIANAMAHLELNKIVHRDLAARNVLVGATLDIIKLADFGMARCLNDKIYYRSEQGLFPYKWTAPEAFNGGQFETGRFTTASDVWSFSVTLWEIYSKGAIPYPDFDFGQVYDQVTKENYRLPCPTSCNPRIYDKMNECWDLDPNSRPTFAQLHTFLLDPYEAAQQ